ncbi:MAG TPA: diphthine--ammonia ligase [archaeon]|nr:diphthine--ammonia ligase [archaeon]
MKLAALVSGGKDSIYSLYMAGKNNEIVHILSFLSENKESYMFHVPNMHLVEEQAKLMSIPMTYIKTKGVKEEELDDIKSSLMKLKKESGIEGVVTGAVASVYQKSRIDDICKDLDLKSIAPIWGMPLGQSVADMIEEGFEIIIVAVAAPPLDEKWLGRKLDKKCLEELMILNKKYGIHPNGEGGEFESLVLDCPLFSKKIVIKESEKHYSGNSGHLEIKKIELVAKT